MSRVPALLQIGVVIFFTSATSLVAQHVPPPPPPSDPQPMQQQGPPGMDPSDAATKRGLQVGAEEEARFLHNYRAQFARQYFLHEKKDVDRILALATEFKDYGDHATNPTLTGEMLKKIHKMEDLVHDLRKLMYAGDAPRIKKSGINLFVYTQNAGSGGPNEPDKRLQDAARLSYGLATLLSDTTYHYLDQANQNTFSIASLATAKEVVSIAAKLEGLAHEVQETYRLLPQAD